MSTWKRELWLLLFSSINSSDDPRWFCGDPVTTFITKTATKRAQSVILDPETQLTKEVILTQQRGSEKHFVGVQSLLQKENLECIPSVSQWCVLEEKNGAESCLDSDQETEVDAQQSSCGSTRRGLGATTCHWRNDRFTLEGEKQTKRKEQRDEESKWFNHFFCRVWFRTLCLCVSLDVGSSILIFFILSVARVGEILGLTFEFLTLDATLYHSIVWIQTYSRSYPNILMCQHWGQYSRNASPVVWKIVTSLIRVRGKAFCFVCIKICQPGNSFPLKTRFPFRSHPSFPIVFRWNASLYQPLKRTEGIVFRHEFSDFW